MDRAAKSVTAQRPNREHRRGNGGVGTPSSCPGDGISPAQEVGHDAVGVGGVARHRRARRQRLDGVLPACRLGVQLSSQTGPERSVLPQLASGSSSGFAITRPTAAMVIRSAAGAPRMPVRGIGTVRFRISTGRCSLPGHPPALAAAVPRMAPSARRTSVTHKAAVPTRTSRMTARVVTASPVMAQKA